MDDLWSVRCPCGFAVEELSTREAAEDTAAWHQGARSALGDWGGEQGYACPLAARVLAVLPAYEENEMTR